MSEKAFYDIRDLADELAFDTYGEYPECQLVDGVIARLQEGQDDEVCLQLLDDANYSELESFSVKGYEGGHKVLGKLSDDKIEDILRKELDDIFDHLTM